MAYNLYRDAPAGADRGARCITIVAMGACLSACGAPSWLPPDGWRAVRCEASAELLVGHGDAILEAQRVRWQQTADPFRSSTDQGLEMRAAAHRNVNWTLDADRKAREFLESSCTDSALAEIRQKL